MGATGPEQIKDPEHALELLVNWKLQELSYTDCGGDFREDECRDCKFYCVCKTNKERREELCKEVMVSE